MAAFANPQLRALMQARALQQQGINAAAPAAGMVGAVPAGAPGAAAGLPGQQWAAALGQPAGGAIGGLPAGAGAGIGPVAAGVPPVSSLAAAQGIAPGWQQALANIGQTSGMMPVAGPTPQQALQAIQGAALPLAGGGGPTPQGAQTPGLAAPAAGGWQQALARLRSRA